MQFPLQQCGELDQKDVIRPTYTRLEYFDPEKECLPNKAIDVCSIGYSAILRLRSVWCKRARVDGPRDIEWGSSVKVLLWVIHNIGEEAV